MTGGKRKLLVVEDNVVDGYIIQSVIKGYNPAAEVLVFHQPEKALAYLQNPAVHAGGATFTLLLDIQMPHFDGWQFLEAFEALPEGTKASCRLYMLTSSILPADKLRAGQTGRVLDYFNKPLKGNHLKVIFAEDEAGAEDRPPV
jgi:CheY-like chemotaxis protein